MAQVTVLGLFIRTPLISFTFPVPVTFDLCHQNSLRTSHDGKHKKYSSICLIVKGCAIWFLVRDMPEIISFLDNVATNNKLI